MVHLLLPFQARKNTPTSFRGVILAVFISMMAAVSASAQITTSAISGHVSDGKEPISETVVTVVHEPTGQHYYVFTSKGGYYVINNILVGGPYTVRIERLNFKSAIINEVLGDDIKTHITKDMLESADIVNVEIKDEVRQQYEAQFVAQERRIMEQQEQQRQQERLEQARQEERRHLEEENRRIERDLHAVNGRMIRELLGNVAWFTAMAHGRELVVGEIRVDRTQGDHYLMTAEINGQKVAHAISQKDYDRFLALDDAHRLTMFQDVFKKEVSIRHAAPQVYDRDVVTMTRDGAIISNEEMKIEHSRSSHVDGQNLDQLKGNKGFYTEIAHGREVEVGKIEVLREDSGKYKMTAVIDGNAVSREITEKQFNKFLAVDDYQRMKLFAKVFDGVDIKTRPGQGTNVGAAILAALVTATDVAHLLNRGAAPPPITEPRETPVLWRIFLGISEMR